MFKKHVLQRPKVQAKQQSYCCFVFAFSLVFCYSLTLSHKEHKELKHNLYCVCFFFFSKENANIGWKTHTCHKQNERHSQCFNVFCFIAFCTTMRQSKREETL